ncbi:carbohydrate kinase family protein [Streptomyces sp. MNP-20]|uniref:carbohydrate kinase family protein n=1 Tax=Streptomyces sp. MNP-20 TaxID=2721165 RepID=UPI001553595C|nr:carbohydrate kinase family protein [Streptomyces sp. MNP-20]
MTALARQDLACFSYLAHAQILHVNRYPGPDQGAPVLSSRTSLAGDGPLTAMTAARLGLTACLIANQVGDDPAGRAALDQLRHAGVNRLPSSGPRPAATPNLTVITDSLGTRTWFADLTGAHASLAATDMTALGRARLAYIDCYTLIAPLAARAIETAAHAGVPVFLNLGNDPIHPTVADAARHADVHVVQTGLTEPLAPRATTMAQDMLERLRPQAAVVTLGSLGAVAATAQYDYRVAAPAVRVSDSHGAGAVFSAALATAHLRDADLLAALRYACDTATACCADPPAPPPHTTACSTPPHPAERTACDSRPDQTTARTGLDGHPQR